MEKMLTLREAAEIARCSTATLNRARLRGLLETTKPMGRVLVSEAQLHAFVNGVYGSEQARNIESKIKSKHSY